MLRRPGRHVRVGLHGPELAGGILSPEGAPEPAPPASDVQDGPGRSGHVGQHLRALRERVDGTWRAGAHVSRDDLPAQERS